MKISNVKRGDTVIEVMVALAIFGMVSVLTIASMNRGLASAETALEATTAREELDAQAEALRFMYNSIANGSYDLWSKITSSAVKGDDANHVGLLNLPNYILEPNSDGVAGCNKVYAGSNGNSAPLNQVHAFVLNPRKLNLDSPLDAYVGYKKDLFRESQLGARILYKPDTDDAELADSRVMAWYSVSYSDVEAVEGIWVFAVASKETAKNNNKPIYYDFYIQACWYGAGANTPTTLDTVIRFNTPGTL